MRESLLFGGFGDGLCYDGEMPMIEKPLDHPDYLIPGTRLTNFSKWSRENIPKPPHRFPVGQVVTVDLNDHTFNVERLGNREVVLEICGKATLIVVAHLEDCDGTALYHLAAEPIAPPEDLGERMKWIGWVRFQIHGFSDESLTPIEPPAVLPVMSWIDFKRSVLSAY